jgi:hypothetical protein
MINSKNGVLGMGRHQPPGWGHERRFIVALLGIAVLAFAVLALVALLFPESR